MRTLLALILSVVSLQAGLLVDSCSRNGAIKTVVTEASITPTANQTVVSAGWNGLRVWTGSTPVSEAYFDLYVSKNGGTATKLRVFRWMGRILTATSGDSFSFGTSDGRTIYLTPMYAPATTETPAGVTGTANCDKAGPPIWTPVAAHVNLPSNAHSFIINSDGTERNVFLSEFDGYQWTPLRWLKLEASRSATVRTSYRKIALANYDGATLSITAPAGSTVGGTMSTMSLTFPTITGTSRAVSTVAELKTAIAAAVAGDEIVLADGTYAMDVNIAHTSFTANEVAGKIGFEGITFRSASGDRDAVVISRSSDTTGGWIMDQRGNTGLSACFKNLTFDGTASGAIDATLYGVQIYDQNILMQNVRFTGSGPVADGMGNLYFRQLADSDPVNISLLNCEFDGQRGRMLNFCGYQSVSPTTNPGTRRAINCTVHNGSTTAGIALGIAHYYVSSEIYGGSFYDSQASVFTGGNGGSNYFFFTNFPQTNTTARSGNAMSSSSLFGVNWSNPSVSGITMSNFTYAVFCYLTNTVNQACTVFLTPYAAPIAHNFFAFTSGTAFQATTGSELFLGNIVRNGAKAAYASGYTGSLTDSINVKNNTATLCKASTFDSQLTNVPSFWINNVGKGNTVRDIYSPSMVNVTGDYNVFKTVLNYVPGAHDTTGADAAIDANYFPTASGNCDGNGDTSVVDYVGGSDPWGLVLVYKPSRVSRGAREIPAVYSGATLYPDIW